MRHSLFVLALAAACTSAAEHADRPSNRDAGGTIAGGTTAAVDSTRATTTDTVVKTTTTVVQPTRKAETPSQTTAGAPVRRADPAPAIVRALYVNRWATQSRARMAKLIAVADSTEINAFVLDMKDEFGLNYKTSNPEFEKNAGSAGKANVKALLDTLKNHNILAIARIVVFKDSVTARVHPEWTIRRTDGSIWRDHKGLAWVNPYHRELWDYNIGVAEELAQMGFGEIQFDYIRFPEPFPSLPKQVFPGSNNESKPGAIADFLKEAKPRINKYGVRSTADIFGLVAQVEGPLEVAQHWERLSPVVDVMLPMVYPSHYPRGEFGMKNPNAEPYKIVYNALVRARQRDQKLGITEPEHVRPWLQAFTLGKPPYNAAEMEAMKKATYDAGYDGWVLWNPGSIYDGVKQRDGTIVGNFLPAFEKTLVSRKKKS